MSSRAEITWVGFKCKKKKQKAQPQPLSSVSFFEPHTNGAHDTVSPKSTVADYTRHVCLANSLEQLTVFSSSRSFGLNVFGRQPAKFQVVWISFCGAMEHGSFTDETKSTFSVADEDHTLANTLRYTLNQDPRVTFCGYSIPHPSDNRVNIRVQTTGDPAREVLKDACQNLMVVCQHVRNTFDKAVLDVKLTNPVRDINIK
ncbi:hypothetical protein Csa_014245 [Cucumis sativus]|nr:hypothetical protein Csa_014245 [Cucumis sativus]